MVSLSNGRLQAQQSFSLGLQISFGLVDKVSLCGVGRRCRTWMSGAAEGDIKKQGNAEIRGIGKSGSCAYADLYSAEFVGIEGSTVFEG